MHMVTLLSTPALHDEHSKLCCESARTVSQATFSRAGRICQQGDSCRRLLKVFPRRAGCHQLPCVLRTLDFRNGPSSRRGMGDSSRGVVQRLQPTVSRTAPDLGVETVSSWEVRRSSPCQYADRKASARPSVGALTMPSHSAWSRAMLPCCGSELRTDRGQTIKRPVTLFG